MKFQIKEAREAAGYSQKELAKIIGVAPNTFHGYESGKHDPKSDHLIKIAKACHVSVDYLMGFSDEPHQTGETKKGPTSQMADEARERVITQLCQMSPEDFELVDAFVKWMKSARRGE